MELRQLPEDRASCSQDRRTSPSLGHWAGEWPRSQKEYAVNQLASGELASNRTEDHELSLTALPPVFPGLLDLPPCVGQSILPPHSTLPSQIGGGRSAINHRNAGYVS
jgi:hypothetical protein